MERPQQEHRRPGNDYDSYPLAWDDRNAHDNADGQFHEMGQIKSGFLSADTTLVALSVGGNDAGFPSVTMCATTGCPSEEDVASDINKTIPKIEKVLREIHANAPNAKIILMGCPQLFNEDSLTCVSGVGGARMIRINIMARYMTDKQEQLVTSLHSAGVPVTYESPDSDFAGKRACDDPEGAAGQYQLGAFPEPPKNGVYATISFGQSRAPEIRQPDLVFAEGVTAQELLLRAGVVRRETVRERTDAQAELSGASLWAASRPLVRAGRCGDWGFLMQSAGTEQLTRPEVLRRLSRDTRIEP